MIDLKNSFCSHNPYDTNSSMLQNLKCPSWGATVARPGPACQGIFFRANSICSKHWRDFVEIVGNASIQQQCSIFYHLIFHITILSWYINIKRAPPPPLIIIFLTSHFAQSHILQRRPANRHALRLWMAQPITQTASIDACTRFMIVACQTEFSSFAKFFSF